uniref:Adenosine deaminase domain-containing protein n=1 Tax=Amphimedon queenslandica TaxID=400682 RepID=A0A1X7SGU6_AMPQE
TDDKGVFNTTLSKEYFIAAKTFGLTEEEIEKISKDAMKYTFDSNVQLNELLGYAGLLIQMARINSQKFMACQNRLKQCSSIRGLTG